MLVPQYCAERKESMHITKMSSRSPAERIQSPHLHLHPKMNDHPNHTRFQSPGYIHVLNMQANNRTENEPRRSSAHKALPPSSQSCQVSCTKSYNPEDLVADHQIYLKSSSDAWDKFDDYISAGLPVKIDDYSRFCNRNNRSFNGTHKPRVWGEGNHNDLLSDIIQRMPLEAMECMATVQCLPVTTISNTYSLEGGDDDDSSSPCHTRKRARSEQAQYTTKEIDDMLSSACRAENVPLFMGQDDQLSAQMKLGDVLNGTPLTDDSNGSSIYPHICVAQESIMSTSSSSASEINCTDSRNKIEISCQDNGSICYIYDEGDDDEMMPPRNCCALAPLSDGVVAPSYLLPNDKVCLHNINFWYAPKSSMTNWHHDGNSNILVVVHGMKTVELAPPGAIKASAICSDHANHPSVLHPRNASQACINDEIQKNRKNLDGSRMIVTISRGGALFIPEGWWHRVESSAETMAINFWFDRRQSSIYSLVRPSNKHMLPFQVRELARLYFNEHFADAVASRMRNSILKIRQSMSYGCKDIEANIFCANGTIFDNWVAELKTEVAIFLDGVDNDSECEEIRLGNVVQQLEFILLQANVKNNSHCDYIKKLFEKCFGQITTTYKRQTIFCRLIMRLSMSACYNVLEVWDSDCDSNEQRKTPPFFLQFVEMCGSSANEVVDHVKAEHLRFKITIAQKLIMNDLMLEHVQDLF